MNGRDIKIGAHSPPPGYFYNETPVGSEDPGGVEPIEHWVEPPCIDEDKIPGYPISDYVRIIERNLSSGINVQREETDRIRKAVEEIDRADEMRKTEHGFYAQVLREACDVSLSTADRIQALLNIDRRKAVRASGLSDEKILEILSSPRVGYRWKLGTVEEMMFPLSDGALMFPLEFGPVAGDKQSDRGCVLKLLFDRKYRILDLLALKGKLKRLEGVWGEILLQTLFYNIYSNHRVDNRRLEDSVRWLEKVVPGTVARAADKYGNNAAIYLASICFTTAGGPISPEVVLAAKLDIALLESLGCDVDAKNIFGISALPFLDGALKAAETAFPGGRKRE